MNLYYLNGTTPIPTDKIIRWAVVGNTLNITFQKKAFSFNKLWEMVMIYPYDTEQLAIDDANSMHECMCK